MKILLVDDHAVVRQGYASLLRALLPEVQVSEAYDGEQALAQVQLEIPSLIIMDVGLPGISGLETLRRLRQQRCFSVWSCSWISMNPYTPALRDRYRIQQGPFWTALGL